MVSNDDILSSPSVGTRSNTRGAEKLRKTLFVFSWELDGILLYQLSQDIYLDNREKKKELSLQKIYLKLTIFV